MKRWTDFVKPLSLLVILNFLLVTPGMAAGPEPEAEAVLLPYEYARVWQDPVAVYASPGDPAAMKPIDTLLPPDSWVSIDEVVEQDGRQWYRIDQEAYVLAEDVLPGTPSLFHGVTITQPLTSPLVYIATQGLNVRARPGAASDNPPLGTLNRYETANFLGSQRAGDALWHQIGENRWIHGAYARVVFPVQRPEGVPADARWIAVDLAQQTLSAYEGDQLVFVTLVSTGRPPWFTPKGLNRIWIKKQTGDMRGGIVERGDYYALQDVPWIMYFNKDVGLHAAYWHDRFGYPSSHGCVNLSPLDARWLFDWATPQLPFPDSSHIYASQNNPGTWVYVYASSG
jgi:hypothetical protein